MKNKKKGFTIVELVIVIAVIGVLAAVLIPVFTRLIRKSKVNTDTQLIRNLNTALSADSANGKHKNMTDALKAAEAFGYDVSKINASATNNEILWDSKNDVFCYLNDGVIEYYPSSVSEEKALRAGSMDLWRIYKGSVPSLENQSYSIYVGDAAAAASVNEIKVGIDCGEQEVGNIVYKNNGDPQSVIINTNSPKTNLTIDAAGDTVNHYGEVGSLNIIAVANASYHENGTVAFAEIKTGRIVLESDAIVNHIHLTVSLDDESKTYFNNITVAKAEEVKMPVFSRDAVEIKEEGTLVVALQAGTETTDEKDYVWLTAVGVYEQVTVSSQVDNAGTSYAAESDDQEKKDTALQICNNISVNAGGDTYTVKAEKNQETGDWDYVLVDEEGEKSTEYTVSEIPVVTVTTETVEQVTTTTTEVTVSVVDTNEDAVVTETAIENGLSESDKETKQNEIVQEVKEQLLCGEQHIMFNDETSRFYLTCPRCGVEFGTETHPYKISNAAEFEALIKLRDWDGYDGYYKAYRTDPTGEKYEYLYANLTKNVDCSTVNYPTGYSNVYYLVLNGNNYTLSNINNKPFNNGYGITLKNLTISNFTGATLMSYCYYGFDFENVTFSNCNCNYLVQYPFKGAAEGDFICKNVNFNDCTFTSAFSYIYDAHLTMQDCTFNNCTSKSGSSLLAYGGYHAYNGYASGLSLVNVDIRNSRAYGGAYIYYGGGFDFPISFVNCDVTNTKVTGGNGMALGGFIGNASSSHVSFNYCTFDGTIESVSDIAAGFIGQPNNAASYCLISNSTISASTVILNKGGTGVAVFNGQGNNYNNNNNHFYGTIQSTGTKSNAKLNGFTDATFTKYSAIATSADFVLEANGTIRYTGSESFDRLVISQRLAVDEMKSGLGGYPWEVAPRLEVENVSGASTIGTIQKVSDMIQVVDEENLESVRYSTTDDSLLTGTMLDKEGVYFNDGVVVLNSKVYESGVWYIFSDTDADSTKTTFTVNVLVEIFNGGEIVCGIPMSYTFTPNN